MKKSLLFLIILLATITLSAQNDSIQLAIPKETTYKKRVLEQTELDLLSSFYTQSGANAAVTGGIGNEHLNDYATNIVVSIPLNDDDVLTIDGTVSAYTSASSSNLNPFYIVRTTSSGVIVSGASRSGGRRTTTTTSEEVGSPWLASSGASKSDVWRSMTMAYSHTSDDRNTMFSSFLSTAREYDYGSFGAGFALSRQFNEKNTEFGVSANLYLDHWLPQYPTELKTYIDNNGNLNVDYFAGVSILNASGQAISKTGMNGWRPSTDYLITTDQRKTYSVSLSFSQILSKSIQVSIFSDAILQKGWLANPMQRVYFSDRNNYYIGQASSIRNYENPTNTTVFQLADDIERLPESRLKIPIGVRYNHYLNENLSLRTYYRYYFDDWGVQSHTLKVELPVKLGMNFTLYPNYRYYTQTAADYFAPYEQHLSTETYYTSDYDLSAFDANQFGVGIKYTDIFTKGHLGKFGLKNLSLNYAYYRRSTGLNAHIVSVGAKLVLD